MGRRPRHAASPLPCTRLNLTFFLTLSLPPSDSSIPLSLPSPYPRFCPSSCSSDHRNTPAHPRCPLRKSSPTAAEALGSLRQSAPAALPRAHPPAQAAPPAPAPQRPLPVARTSHT